MAKTGSVYRVEISDEELYARYLASDRDASSLAPILGVTPSRARARIRKLLARMESHPVTKQLNDDRVNRIAELLERSNVDPNTIERIGKVRLKSYGIGIKNAEGRFEQHGLHSTSLEIDPVLHEGDNPCLTQAPPITVSYANEAPRIIQKMRTVFVVSDAQIGFLNGPNGLEPIHDPLAVDVTMQLIDAIRPDELIWIGDWLDLTAFSRWPQHPEFQGTSQASIDAGSRILGEMISAAGRYCTKRMMISGNHDIRLERYAQTNAKEFLGLRRANMPEEWPINSMPFLLHFESLGISYGGLYPGGEHWITDDLVATHAPTKKLEMAASVVHGHDHKLTRTTFAQHGRHRRHNYFEYSVGCICKVGSRSDASSLIRTQTPSDRARTDWAQGVACIEILDGKHPQHQLDHVGIREGVALYRGQAFVANGVATEEAAQHGSP